MRPPPAALSALLCMGLPLSSQRVQAPDAPWKTITTAHYRIHYPANPAGGFEPFAREVASKIEGIHARVTHWVGYESPRTVDVLIRDPLLVANGSAFPLLDHPFVELWKTPPESDSAIAHYTTWPELLVTHELTHVHHLVRPQNQPRLWDKLVDLPVGPLAFKAPRWVAEGYATLIEGKITGSGRPHGAYRAAVLRQWSLQGKLPDYDTLDGNDGFRGGNLAYLVGGAYLEWLERQNANDPEILRKFWKQLASKKRRNFDASFKATFGTTAHDGYDRWRAETTHDALELERRVKTKNLIREGEVWTRIPGEVTDLSVSPGGAKLLARVVTPKFKGLMVWDLIGGGLPKDTKPKAREEDPVDPNEAMDRKDELVERKAKWELGRTDGFVPYSPAWGNAKHGEIFFVLRTPNEEGMLEPRRFRWSPGLPPQRDASLHSVQGGFQPFLFGTHGGIWNIGKREKSSDSIHWLTRTLSAAWNPAPTPDGKWLYYTQLTATGCEIRKLDLSLPPLTEDPLPVDEKPITPRTILPPSDEKSELPQPVPPPPAHDYSIGETLWSGFRSGATIAPSGESYELGYGGSDFLRRFSWQALAAFGSGAGPRGAEISIAYRGWRWAPSLQLFSSLERPSAQRFKPLQGFDRQRSGAEVAFTWESRNTTPAFFVPLISFERVRFQNVSKPTISRGFAGLNFGISHFWGRGENWGLLLSAQAKDGAGRTDGHSWQSQRGHVAARISTPWIPLTLKAESARVLGNPTTVDQLHLGGLTTSLVPSSLDWNRVEQAALPAYSAAGDRMHRLRAEVGSGLRAYIEYTALWNHTQPRPTFIKVAGLEFVLAQALGHDEIVDRLVGRMTFIVGIHRILNNPENGFAMRDRTVGTLSLVLRP